MTAPIIRVYTTISSKLEELPVVDGQLIFVQDLRTVYLDNHGMRLPYTVIDALPTEEDRVALKDPAKGFYYTEDSNVLWRYNGEKWIALTSSNSPHIMFKDEVSDFPTVGDSNTVYTNNSAIYRWDNDKNKYVMISNKTAWNRIGA